MAQIEAVERTVGRWTDERTVDDGRRLCRTNSSRKLARNALEDERERKVGRGAVVGRSGPHIVLRDTQTII